MQANQCWHVTPIGPAVVKSKICQMRKCSTPGIRWGRPLILTHTIMRIRKAPTTTAIAQIMGHSNIQTTTRYIANNDPAHQRAATVMETSVLELLKPQNDPLPEPQ